MKFIASQQPGHSAPASATIAPHRKHRPGNRASSAMVPMRSKLVAIEDSIMLLRFALPAVPIPPANDR